MHIYRSLLLALTCLLGSAMALAIPLEDPIPETIEAGDIEITLVEVASELISPLHGAAAPGDTTRLFIADQTGLLQALDLATGAISTFLDVTDRVVYIPGGYDERGFLGVVFDPDYAANGYLYTYTSEAIDGVGDFPLESFADHQSVVSRWEVPTPSDPTSLVDVSTRKEILRLDQPSRFHNGGGLAFDNDGMLLIALGNGGPLDTGQDNSNPLGSILRIDLMGSNSANGAYGIPSDNPFVGVEGVVEEIFATGFRNAFRISVDKVTGDIWGSDVGNNDIEEVNLVQSGLNYGFNRMEGSFCFVGTGGQPTGNPGVSDPSECDTTGLENPFAEYDHDEGTAVIGGYVYRGTDVADMTGRYVYGDYSRFFSQPSGRLFYLDDTTIREMKLAGKEIGGNIIEADALDMQLLGMGEDANGEIYVLGNDTGRTTGTTGTVFRIDSGPGRTSFLDDQLSIEEDVGSIQLIVNRSGGNKGQATVNYTVAAGTASAGDDFTATSGELVWMDREDGDKEIEIAINDDGQEEESETIVVTLTDASGAPLGEFATIIITLLDTGIADGGGCTLSNNGAPDPTFPALLLMALAYQIRRKWLRVH